MSVEEIMGIFELFQKGFNQETIIDLTKRSGRKISQESISMAKNLYDEWIAQQKTAKKVKQQYKPPRKARERKAKVIISNIFALLKEGYSVDKIIEMGKEAGLKFEPEQIEEAIKLYEKWRSEHPGINKRHYKDTTNSSGKENKTEEQIDEQESRKRKVETTDPIVLWLKRGYNIEEIEKEAAKLGLSISEECIKKAIEQYKAWRVEHPNGKKIIGHKEYGGR